MEARYPIPNQAPTKQQLVWAVRRARKAIHKLNQSSKMRYEMFDARVEPGQREVIVRVRSKINKPDPKYKHLTYVARVDEIDIPLEPSMSRNQMQTTIRNVILVRKKFAECQ